MASNPNESGMADFKPPTSSTPERRPSTGGPLATSTPKKIRFMDANVSKIHVFPHPPPWINNQDKKKHNYSTTLPDITDGPKEYAPILYTFRLPEKFPKMMSHMPVRTPPFYLQLDHTIAVIWILLSPSSKKDLGISQMQWAYSFLRSLRNRNGEIAKDVQLLIDGMIDYLLELYADISFKLDELHNMEHSQVEEEEGPIEVELPFSLTYSELLPKFDNLTQSALDGGHLVNIDEVYKLEVEELKDVLGTDSVELITSKSREAAIDYLNSTADRHMKNLLREAERLISLENLLNVISSENDTSRRDNAKSLVMSVFADESSDINNTTEMKPANKTA